LDDRDAKAGGIWPALEALARPARERKRLPPDTRSRIILELCKLAPLSVKELSILLDRSEAYVGDAIRPLVTAGDLIFLYPDQPRHPKQKYLASGNGWIRTEPVAEPVATQQTLEAPRLEPVERIVAHTAPPPSRFPNQLTNIAVVVITGILLATLRTGPWFLFALLAALALSMTHILAHSSQYEKFSELQNRNRGLMFIVLKAGVAVIEIVIVYFATSAITS
jgi:hypothetical protein